MILTVYYDGQFWTGVIELHHEDRLKVFRYVFGSEPKDVEVLDFVNNRLLSIIEGSKQSGIKIDRTSRKRVSPKRLQRLVAKEMKKEGISSKAQEALKADMEKRRVEKQKVTKQHRDEMKQKKWEIKKQKAKQKKKGH